MRCWRRNHCQRGGAGKVLLFCNARRRGALEASFLLGNTLATSAEFSIKGFLDLASPSLVRSEAVC
jgi:hypothetical protein